MGRTMRQRRRKVLQSDQCHLQKDKTELLLEWMQAVADGWRPFQLKLHTFTLASSFQLRGLMTLQPVVPGQVLINVPHQLVITKDVAARALPTKVSLLLSSSSHQILALFLVSERAKGHQSFWRHYLNSLPDSYETPCFSTPDESSMYPPYLKKVADRQRELLLRKFLQCRAAYGALDFNNFRWAWFTVNSRGVYSPDGSDNLALVPFLDMFNHSPEVRVKAETRPDGSYAISNVNMTYRPGEQALINYGPHSNTALYTEYGFVLLDNPDDYFPLDIDDLARAVGPSSNKRRHDACLTGLGVAGLGVSRGGAVSWNTAATMFVLSGRGSVEEAYQTEDFFKEDGCCLRAKCATLIDEKLCQVRKSVSHLLECRVKNKKLTASAGVALELMKLHIEILERASKSFSN